MDAGADAIGLVFYPPSPRNVSVELAKEIVQSLPPFVQSVGLFVNPDREFVEEVLSEVPLSLLQFHGDEDEAFCKSFHRSYMKAVRVKPGLNLTEIATAFPSASGLLLDAYKKDNPGGTGHTFDWSLIPDALPLPVVLAGGLKPGNIVEAIQATRPFAVDVSSGVEETKGVKSPEKIVAFMRGVIEADE